MTDRILAKLKEKEEEEKKKAESKHLKTEPNKHPKTAASGKKPIKRNQTEAHIKPVKQAGGHEAPKKTIPNSKSVSNFNRTAGGKKEPKEAPKTPVKKTEGDTGKKVMKKNQSQSLSHIFLFSYFLY